MNTKEKIEKACDTDMLCLYKEGAFCKLYNQHTLLFVENFKPLKVTVKFIKIVNQHVYSAGFPISSIEDIKKELLSLGGSIKETDKVVMVSAIGWKKTLIITVGVHGKKTDMETGSKQSIGMLTSIEKEIQQHRQQRQLLVQYGEWQLRSLLVLWQQLRQHGQ